MTKLIFIISFFTTIAIIKYNAYIRKMKRIEKQKEYLRRYLIPTVCTADELIKEVYGE